MRLSSDCDIKIKEEKENEFFIIIEKDGVFRKLIIKCRSEFQAYQLYNALMDLEIDFI